MKICPQCQTSYTDDSLRFCLQDGTPLQFDSASAPTVAWKEPETVVRNPTTWQPAPEKSEPRKSRLGLAIFLTALVMLGLFGIGAIGAFIYFRNADSGFAKIPTPPVVNKSPSPNLNTNVLTNANSITVANANSNANVAATPTATPTPTPKPTIDPGVSKQIREDVGNVIDEWKAAAENLDLDSHMNQYAPMVDYYRAGKIRLAQVRADKEKAFSRFESINVEISDLTITPDATGENAIAVFDKEWTFDTVERTFSGKVRQQLTLTKTAGAWKISGEKDLKVYFLDR
jgi:hypothetical protein